MRLGDGFVWNRLRWISFLNSFHITQSIKLLAMSETGFYRFRPKPISIGALFSSPISDIFLFSSIKIKIKKFIDF